MRNSFSLSLIAIVAMTLSSCTDWVETELVPSIPSLAGGTVTEFTVSMNTDGTRAGLDTNETSVWHSGDNMTIVKFNPGQVTPQVLHAAALDATISDDGKTMTFACEMPIHAEGEQYAIFPAQSSTAAEDYTNGKIGNRTFNVELPEQELAQDGTFRYPFLLGHWKEPASVNERGSFQFTNPFTILKITLKKPANENHNLVLTNIQVKGNNEELMWGTAEASIADNGNGTFTKGVKMLQGAEYFASLDTRVDGVGQTITTEGNDFYVCIPAQNYSKGMTLTFFCEGDDDASIWYMEKTLMSRGVDCSAKGNTLVTLPALELNVEKSNIFTALVRSTVSTLAVAWTTSVNNSPYLAEQKPNLKADYKKERDNIFCIELWSAWDYDSAVINGGNGAAGTASSPKNLVTSWLIKDNCWYERQGDVTSKAALYNNSSRPLRFVFTGLEPGTDYYLRVKYMTPDKWSDSEAAEPSYFDSANWTVLENPRKMTTLPSPALDANTILFEDFSDCVLGGDFSTRSAGYSNYVRRFLESPTAAKMNVYGTPYASNANNLIMPNRAGLFTGAYGQNADWYIVPSSVETGLFDTVQQIVFGTTADASRKSPALKYWSWENVDYTENSIFMRAGYVKVGGHYKQTRMITPQLNAKGTSNVGGQFSGPSTVDVEFWICPYGADVMDDGERDIAIEVLDGGTFTYDDTTSDIETRWDNRATYNTLSGFTISNRKEIRLEGNQYTWTKYTVRFTGVLPTSRIAFAPNRPEKDANNRFLLDDVCIKWVESSPLTVKLVRATDTTISIAWSALASNIPTMASPMPDANTTNFSTEIGDTYAVAIYDENKTLMGKLSGVCKDTSTTPKALFTTYQRPPRWIFTGLTPSTNYFVKVWNTTDGTETDYLEVSTTASAAVKEEVVPLNKTAVSGQMLLFENFGTMLYGGDATTRAAGYKHKNRATGVYVLATAGEQTHKSSAYFAGPFSDNVNLFSTMPEMVDDFGLDGWSWVKGSSLATYSGINVRPGYLQIGTSTNTTWFATPALTNMPVGKSSLRVTFKACPYGGANATLSDTELLEKVIAVRILTGGEVNGEGAIDQFNLVGYTVADTKKLTLEGDNNTVWKEYTLQFDYVPQGARVAFGGGIVDNPEDTTVTDAGDNNRWMLDDVKIELLSNAEIAVGVVRATDTTINIGWTVTESNKSANYLALMPRASGTDGYDYKTTDVTHNYRIDVYYDEACTNLYQRWNLSKTVYGTDGVITTNGYFGYKSGDNNYFYPTRMIITGLEPSTTYYVKITDTTASVTSNSIPVSTVAPQYQGAAVVTDPTVVKQGNTILFENFGDFYYGGDMVGYASGYYNAGVNDQPLTVNYKATGESPTVATAEYDFARVRGNGSLESLPLFTTLEGLLDDYGMADWSQQSTDGTCKVYAMPGYVKLGDDSGIKGTLITPLLTTIPEGEIWNVTVRCKMAPYYTIGYGHNVVEDEVVIGLVEGGTIDEAHMLQDAVNIDQAALTLNSEAGWNTYEVELKNATCNTRILIGGNGSNNAKNNRFYVDDIQVILSSPDDNKYLTGYVYENDGVTPVEGVMVTDGYHVVKTNAKGRYQIIYDPSVYKPEYVYYTTPAGYEIGRNGSGYPVTYYKVGDTYLNPDAGDYAKNFTLGPKMSSSTHSNFNDATGKHNKWWLFVMADPQTKSSGSCIERFSNALAPDIKTRVKDFNSAIDAANGDPQGYGVVLGDVTWNDVDEHKATMKSAMAVNKTGIYWFAAAGNHDWYQSDDDATPDISAFKEAWGPTRISFDRGDMHVVVINDVVTKDSNGANLGQTDYVRGFTDEEWTWLKNDLSHVDKNKGVVLCVHIPFMTVTKNYFAQTLTELAKFQHAYILSGHSHIAQTYLHKGYVTQSGDYVTEILHPAAFGVGWNYSINADGTPAGYAIYTFQGNRCSIQRWKSVGSQRVSSGASSEYGRFNNIRMYWAADKISVSTNKIYPYTFGVTNYNRVAANVFMAHQGGGVAGELSGDWIVQMWDPYQSRWENMELMNDSGSFGHGLPTGYTNIANYTNYVYKTDDGADRIRNDIDWWFWGMALEDNAYSTSRNGTSHKSATYYTSGSYAKECKHIFWGKLNPSDGHNLTEAEVMAAGVKVRAIPPTLSASLRTAALNGEDISDSNIYVCNTFTRFDRSKTDKYGLDWDSVITSANEAHGK